MNRSHESIPVKENQYGPCGLYCGACGAKDCDGCRSDRTDDLVKACRFKKCAGEKQVEFCCFCDDFPCRPLDEFMADEWPHHWTMKPNLDNWLGRQKEVWSCPGCGAEIIWYQKECRCGQALEGWDLPSSFQKK
jgi:hypothetical protein